MIYHYCSLENLLKIVESKELFLFNANSMNDSLETNWIIHLIIEELSKRKNDFKNEDIMHLDNHFRLNRTYPYLSCFSTDDDSLSQWRAYANDGKGVAIGFNEEYFGIKKMIPVNTMIVNDSIGYEYCNYDENNQRELINSALDKVLPFIKNKKSTEVDFMDTTDELVKYSTVFKNPRFSEEKEVRLIHTPMIMGVVADNTTRILTKISDINYVVKNNKIASYFKFDLRDKFNSDLIPEIVLGPKSIFDKVEFETYLSVNNLNKTGYRRSKASYV